ncbi:penicillin-binding protein 2 [Alkalidesulfovibrio alkalitolerans DSM 16529]|uniref:Penicillin-binding protein 2 n=1 Tax=Alkalidesulfovibrio alkalitolerans DSM 16529 TaxID=1121439 RepID=S7T6S8_9BACT|nr:penicillin-binding protein 2 [Alkalidesulfovibrio alkalitolerans]EPR32777.1 penicillin-binding protein 2 [Alkalidesulfovibrio alkalitolerans DSM 16529]
MRSALQQHDGASAPRSGLVLLQVLVVGLFCLFAIRLWYLQIHKGEFYSEKARDNRLRHESMYAPRGLIRDRLDRLLSWNEPAYALAVVREDVRDMDATLAKVAQWTGIPREEIDRIYEKGRRRTKSFEPLILATDMAPELLARAEANVFRWPGLEIVVKPKRFYPQNDLLAHVLGYVAEANEEELERDKGLSLGDSVGKRGIELVREQWLRGAKGLRQIEVDAAGRQLSSLVVRDPRSGNDMRLSVDLDIQVLASRLLDEHEHTGTVVVMEPFTGQVLALASRPSFNPNVFVGGLSSADWAKLRDDPRHPMQNRATQSVYPPGSTFKTLVAAAALHEGLIDPRKTVFCSGSTSLGSHVFRCWKKEGHGHVDFKRGLVESCDVYFYDLGQRLGVDRIEAFARKAGFGAASGIELPHEKSGLVPSRQWKLRRFGERWQGGENLNLAIGQGYTQVSPIQLARFYSALVNGGHVVRPTLLMDAQPGEVERLPLSDRHIEMLLETMRDTVDVQHGTARRLRTPGAAMGGKTGTAQVVRLREELRGVKASEIEYRFRDHAWIATWGVKDGRAVVIVVMVEHGGSGSGTAGPIAKALYDYLFIEAREKLDAWPYVIPEGSTSPIAKVAAPPNPWEGKP